MNQFKKIAQKRTLFLVISIVLLVAGFVMAALLGFNYEKDMADKQSVTVEYDVYMTLQDERLDNFAEECLKILSDNGILATRVNATTANGGVLEFVLSAKADKAAVNASVEAIRNLTANSYADGFFTVCANTNVASFHDSAVWLRVGIALGVAVLCIAVYMSIRYKLAMGLSMFVGALHATALAYALTAILRIPVSYEVALVGVIALLLYAAMQVMVFDGMKRAFKKEEYQDKDADTQVNMALARNKKTYYLLTAIFAISCLILAIVATGASRWFMVACVAAVLGSAYTAFCFVPAIYAAMKKIADKKAAEKAKYTYAAKKQA